MRSTERREVLNISTPEGDSAGDPGGATSGRAYDLVIFDCDGVLVDSEVISCATHAEVLSRHGYPITPTEVFDRFLGRSSRQATIEIESELGRALPDEFHRELQEELFGAFAAGLRPVPYIERILDTIGRPFCVASSGSHDKMRASLGATGLYERCRPHIFSATQVAHGKPEPDLFLLAAREMKTSPQRCVVVEDSVSGIRAALSGGMTAFGFTGGSHCRPNHAEALLSAGANAVFADMRQLPDLIDQFRARVTGP